MTIMDVVKSFGFFLVVMALIYGALLLTNWIGKKNGEKTVIKAENLVEKEDEKNI